MYGNPAARVPDLGAHAGCPGRHVQGDGTRECLFPPVHPRELPREGSRPCRGVFAADRGGHTRWRQGVGGAASHSADVRNDHLRDALEVGAELSGSAGSAQPVVQRRALGDAYPTLSSNDGVPVARRSYGTRHRGGGRAGGGDDARRVSPVHGRMDGHAGDHRRQDGGGTIRRCCADVCL